MTLSWPFITVNNFVSSSAIFSFFSFPFMLKGVISWLVYSLINTYLIN